MAVASRQNAVDITITAGDRRSVYSGIIAVDAADYMHTHNLVPVSGDLPALIGDTVFVGPAQHSEWIGPGEVLTADAEGKPLNLTVVGGLPETLEPGENFLVPRAILPRQVWANAPTETVIQVETQQNPGVVAERIERAGIGQVHTVQDWTRARAGRNQAGKVQTLGVLMGLAGLCALMAVVNSVVIAGTERRREFAVFRVTGLRRPRVVRPAVAEATAVVIIGLVLGCAVAAAALAGIGGSVRAAIGVTVVRVPWTLLAVVASGSLAVVAVTSGIAAFLTTREPPVSLITTKE